MNPSKLLEEIKKHKTFLLTTHQNPDPDALCSELACAIFLKKLGKKVYIVNADEFPVRFSFLPNQTWIKTFKKGARIKYDAAIILDCGDLARIDRVQELIDPAKPIFNIDHHVTNTRFGQLNWVNPKASSTTEVLFEIIKRAGVPLNDELAYHLYTGIMTDTGSFRFENATATTLQIVAELRKFTFSADQIYKDVYESMPVKDLKMAAQIVGNMDLLFSGKVIALELRKKDLAEFSKQVDVRDTLFKFLRMIKGVEVVVIFTEVKSNQTRINFRSSSYVDVARVASFFGGGGHIRASGGMIDASIPQARIKVLKEIRKVL